MNINKIKIIGAGSIGNMRLGVRMSGHNCRCG